ncbi:MAG: 4Fe-4S dicluster domain-containing protein [Alkalispirochaeta sp.]
MGIPRERITWFPTISADACIGCGQCVDFCDHGVLEMRDAKAVVTNPYHCVVGCASCQRVCPAEAISFPEQDALIAELKELRAERDAARE